MGLSKNTLKSESVGVNLRMEWLDEVIRTRPNFDFFEIIVDNWFLPGEHHQKLERIREHYPLSFHSVGMNLGGTDPISTEYLKKIRALKKKFEPIHCSDHLCFQSHQKVHHHDLLPIPLTLKNIDHVADRINKVQDFLDEKILIENLSYYIEFLISEMSEFEFIKLVQDKTSCLTLLDLNNLWVNAQNLSLNFQEELEYVNWESVAEIHFAGAEEYKSMYVDTHGSEIHSSLIEKVDFKKLKKIPVLYERDTNLSEGLEMMTEQVLRIRKRLNVS